MSAREPFYYLIGINSNQLSKEEYFLLEAELIVRLCNELKEFFRKKYKSYFHLMKFSETMEDSMLETNLVRLITNDILSTEEYDLNGIAYYADTPGEVIQEMIDVRNTRPSAIFLLRIINIHRSVRRDLYDEMINKIINQLLDLRQ